MPRHNFYLYIATNPRKTVLYTGVTNDLDRRLSEHLQDGTGRRETFAGRYFCFNLVYYEWFPYAQNAISREKEIKGWTRRRKEVLIESVNPEWKFLNSDAQRLNGELPDWI